MFLFSSSVNINTIIKHLIKFALSPNNNEIIRKIKIKKYIIFLLFILKFSFLIKIKFLFFKNPYKNDNTINTNP